MKNFVRKIFFKAFPPILIKEEIDKYMVNHYRSQLIWKGKVDITPTAKIYNLSGIKERIIIEDECLIMGELCVFKYGGQIKIGKNCFVGEGSRIWSGESIQIGDNVLVSHNVNIMDTNSHEIDGLERSTRHISFLKSGHHSEKNSILTQAVKINDLSWVGFNSTILKGVTIGEGAVVGACSLVTKDVEPWTVVGGNPATLIKRLK